MRDMRDKFNRFYALRLRKFGRIRERGRQNEPEYIKSEIYEGMNWKLINRNCTKGDLQL